MIVLSDEAEKRLRLLLADAHRSLGDIAEKVPPDQRAAVRVPRALLTGAGKILDGAAQGPEPAPAPDSPSA